MATVGTVVIDVKADTAKLVSGMDKAEKKVKKSIGDIKKTILTLASAYAGIQGVKAFHGMISESIDLADATGKLAQKLGLSTDSLSEYQYAAGFAAVSSGELSAGLGALVRRLNNFQLTGGGAGKKGFEALGISAEYARENFKTTSDAFEEILKRLEKMPDGFKKTAIAQDIFSKSASSLLRLTATDLKKFSEEAKTIGVSISQGTYEMAAAYHDQMDQLDARMQGIKQTVAFSVVAPMNAASQTAVEMYAEIFGGTDKIASFEDIAVTSIGNVAYSIGFIKDAFTGIELIIKGIELVFYGFATAVSLALEPTVVMINEMIEAYNYLADAVGQKPLELKLESSLPDNISKVQKLKNEIVELTSASSNGRITSGEYMNNLKSNLADIKNSSGASGSSAAEQDEKDRIISLNALKSATDAERIRLQNSYDEIMSASYSSILDNQISLAESAMDWGNSLEGVAVKISNVSKAMIQTQVAGMKGAQKEIAIYDTYSKEFVKYGKKKNLTVEEQSNLTSLQASQDKEIASNRQATQSAEIAGYANLAGAMSSAFEEGSTGAKAFTAIQATLGIVNAYTAITTAWASGPFPANLPAVAAATAGVLPIISQLSSLSGSGGSGGGGGAVAVPDYSSKIDSANYGGLSSAKNVDFGGYGGNVESFVEALDKAGERLSAFGSTGSVTGEQSSALMDAISDTRESISSLEERTRQTGKTYTIETKMFDWLGIPFFTETVTKEYGHYTQLKSETESLSNLLKSFGTFVLDEISNNLDYTRLTMTEVNNIVKDIDLLAYEVMLDDLNDFAIKAKQQGGNLSEADMFSIANIYSSDTYQDALDYADAISLVNESLVISTDNIKSYTDSFKTSKELLQDMPFDIATTADSLNTLFENLKGGVDGLTNSELEFLNANKAYLDAIQNTFDDVLNGWMGSLESASDKIKSTAEGLRNIGGNKSTLSDYYSSISQTNSLLDAGDYDAFLTSLDKTIGLTSVLKDSTNFSTLRDMEFTQLVAANQFDSLNTVVNRELDTLKSIAETNSLSYKLQQDQLSIQEEQANEIRTMRKEIQDLNDRFVA